MEMSSRTICVRGSSPNIISLQNSSQMLIFLEYLFLKILLFRWSQMVHRVATIALNRMMPFLSLMFMEQISSHMERQFLLLLDQPNLFWIFFPKDLCGVTKQEEVLSVVTMAIAQKIPIWIQVGTGQSLLKNFHEKMFLSIKIHVKNLHF